MPLAPGAQLGHYEVLTLVGSGGMGEVYRARDPRLGRDVAIKVLPSEFASDPDRLHRFEQEARAAASLNHPNILSPHMAAALSAAQQAEIMSIASIIRRGPANRRERLWIGFAIMLLALIAALSASPGRAQTDYRPGAANLAAREWFEDARFGLFVHWGVYSVLGDGEWVMNNRRIPIADYEKLPAQFNPTAFDPAEWVALAKSAGMKYITITSKHHDGFAMFDSRISDYNIVARTPYRKDVLKALAEECRRQGLKIFFYYSQLDWHHPDYFPRGRTGRDAGRPEQGEWPRYIEYMNGQLRELLTRYGDVGGIWFDGMWDKPDAPWQLDSTYGLIHRL